MYCENGLVADGDPAVAFGPRPDSNGVFSWSNGSRLYYVNLTSNFGATRTDQTFKGFEAIGSPAPTTSRPPPPATNAWMPTRRSSRAVFDDVLRQGSGLGRQRVLEPVLRHGLRLLGGVRRTGERQRRAGAARTSPSRTTAATRGRSIQISAAANNGQRNPTDGCTIRTDSHGNAYVFGVGTSSSQGHSRSSSCRARRTAARPGRTATPSPDRSPSRDCSTRSSDGRRSTVSPARAATSPRRRASTSRTARRRAPTRRTGS